MEAVSYFATFLPYFYVVLLKRDSDNIIKEDFEDFEAMRKNEKCI
jgi:hypothetical protein